MPIRILFRCSAPALLGLLAIACSDGSGQADAATPSSPPGRVPIVVQATEPAVAIAPALPPEMLAQRPPETAETIIEMHRPLADDVLAAFAGKKFLRGPQSSRRIALTFDDGPFPNLTVQVIEILRRENVPATFFMIGRMVREFPGLARQVAEAGFEIGNHSYNHSNLARKSEADARREIESTQRAIESATARRPYLFRPPQGANNAMVRRICAENGLVVTLWCVDPEDWKASSTADSILATIHRQVGNGAIIDIHDIRAHTVQALPRIIAELRAAGYEFVTVGQLIRDAAAAGESGLTNGPDVLGGSPATEATPTPAIGIPLSDSEFEPGGTQHP